MSPLRKATLLLSLASIPLAHPITHPIHPRHNYALICALSSSITRQCSSAPLFYFCTSAGGLAQNFPPGGPYVVNDSCEEYCQCFDTSPAPPKWPQSCIINIDGSANCNGKEAVAVVANGTENAPAEVGTAAASARPAAAESTA